MPSVVLIVDDQHAVRRMVETMLSQDYTVLTAKDGVDAYELFRQMGGAVDVVLTDCFMPNMDGTELARKLRSEKPDLPILFMSGIGDEVPETEKFIRKPFDRASLRAAVEDALSPDPQDGPRFDSGL